MYEMGDGSKEDDLDQQTMNGGQTAIEQEALNRKIRLGKAHEHVATLIHFCAQSGRRYLDLSNKNISSIPADLYSLTHLEVHTRLSFGFYPKSTIVTHKPCITEPLPQW